MLTNSIKTHCGSCKFLNREYKKCDKGMNIVEHAEELFTLGVCREYLHKDKEGKNIPFKYDLFVMFDEDSHTEQDLMLSIESTKDTNVTRIHIIDISVNRTKNTAFQIFKDYKDTHDLMLHSFLDQPGPYKPIYDTAKNKLKNSCNYFLVMEAGKFIVHEDELEELVRAKTKVVHWNFPTLLDEEEQCAMLYTGLYLKQAFTRLAKKEEPFVFALRERELATGMQLSWVVNTNQIK